MTGNIFCPWEAPTYLFFSSNVPVLIHYSHVVAIFSAITVCLIIFYNSPKSFVSRMFLIFVGLFVTWAIFDVLLWSTNSPSLVMFLWSMQVLIEPVSYAIAFYIFYYFINRQLPFFELSLLSFLILVPVIIFLPTKINLTGLLLSSCESIEGPLAKYYTYFVNLFFIISILIVGLKTIPKLETKRERQIAILFASGLLTFLLSFTSGNLISSFSDDWTISQYGLFGMPIFAAFIGFAIANYQAFNIRLVSAQLLMIVLWGLIGSLLFIIESKLVRVVTTITLFFVLISGMLLIKSVRREVKQREQLELLTRKLKNANTRLKELDKLKSEFVSIASHQLRSPLTSMRGYASMILDGSYGTIPEKAKDALQRIADSSKHMARSVENYLNVSRIEGGNMKYELSDFNLKDEVSLLVDDKRQEAMKKGLLLTFRSNLSGQGIVHADIGKSIEIVHNLVNNALKYTKKGSIEVVVRDDKKKSRIYVDIVDTGVGLEPNEVEHLFAKFSRAATANSVNVSGTGLGLYVGRTMARAMGGDVTVFSDGSGKGSTFTFELPVVM